METKDRAAAPTQPLRSEERTMEIFKTDSLQMPVSLLPVARHTQPDRELVEQFKAGDEDAFQCLVLKYGDRVYRHCFKMVRNAEDSQDLTQEVFLKVFRSFGKYDDQNSFGTWLYRVTANTCLDFLRKKKRTITTVQTEGDPEQLAGAILDTSKVRTPEDHAVESEVLRILNKAVNTLPEKLRDAFILKEFEGYSLVEIAAMLGTCKGTIKTRLHRARQTLQAALDAGSPA